MAIPIKYNLRNLRLRWWTTLATLLGIACVVAVFVLVMALAQGLQSTFLSTGDPRNLLILRKGAMGESSSQITFDEVRRTLYLDGIAQTAGGQPFVSPELIILITLQRQNGGNAHVQVRGLGPVGPELRPNIQLVAGRMFQPGQRECIVSTKVADRFQNCALGQTFRSGRHTWTVVGLFDARRSAYDSEIWMDADEARDAFNRTFYCSIVLRPIDEAGASRIRARIEGDRQMQLEVLSESEYYEEQTKTAAPIRLFGICLAAVMSIGAGFFAMNTMYAAVARRAREIGTLRVLGFKRRAIYAAFMVESLLLALGGGMIGCLLALPLHGLATGTFNWTTFAEVAFEFRVTPALLAAGMAFALVMGVLGGLLPARLAARKPILDALRAT